MDQRGNVGETAFKYPRRVRVGDHNASNAPSVALKELAQVVYSDLPVGTSIDLDHTREGFSAALHRFKSGHGGCSRVRAMGGVRNKDNRTLRIATAAVIRLKHFEAHEFTLRASHRLRGDSRQSCNRLKILLNVVQYLQRALRVGQWRIGVELGKAG